MCYILFTLTLHVHTIVHTLYILFKLTHTLVHTAALLFVHNSSYTPLHFSIQLCTYLYHTHVHVLYTHTLFSSLIYLIYTCTLIHTNIFTYCIYIPCVDDLKKRTFELQQDYSKILMN